MTRILVIIAVAFVMVSAAFGWMLQTYLPDAPLTYPFFYMNPLLKLLALLVVVVTGLGVFGGLKRNPANVRTAVIVSAALGALGAGFGELNTHFGWLYHGPVTFAAMAPGRLQSLAILALGLLGTLPGLAILQLRRGVERN